MGLEKGRSGCCPLQTPHCVISTWARIKKAVLGFLACTGDGQSNSAKVVVSRYRIFQLSPVAVAAISLQPWQCCGAAGSAHATVSALWLLLCRASGAFWSPFLQACGDVRLPGWILCLCGMFSIWWLNSQCCKAGMREKRYEKERCLQETTKDRISKNPVFFLRAAHDTRPGQMSLPIIHTYL